MSKKDKDKRKRGEGVREGGSAWMGDLRRNAEWKSEPPARVEEGAAPVTHRSTEAAESEDDLLDPRFPPLRTVNVEPRSAEDLSEDALADIAPIGPTEYAGTTSAPSEAPRPPGDEGKAAPRPPASMDQLVQQIRDLEARLDEMISHGRHRDAFTPGETPGPPAQPSPTGGPDVAAEAAPPTADVRRPSVTLPAAPPWAAIADRQRSAVTVVHIEGDPAGGPTAGPLTAGPQTPSPQTPGGETRATARDLLPQDYYLRQWGRAGRRKRAEEVDEFGHDPKYEARVLPFFDFLYKTYFRVEAQGTEHIPPEGRCLVVANHSGGPLPYDGIMLRTTVRREHAGGPRGPRELRWLAEDFVYYLPFVGTAMNRLGAVRACQENAERLLGGEHLVAVFPEGAKGVGKLFKERYRLQRFGRGGFIRLCLRTRTPLVPAAIIGAEEANPMLYRLEYMTKTLGIPYLPITPTFPALGPLGLLPAPTKWKVVFGEPVDFSAYGPEAADDNLLVGRLSERVRVTIQAMLDRALAGRQSIWFG